MERKPKLLDSRACFEALVQCHMRYSRLNATPVEIPQETEVQGAMAETTGDLSELIIAMKFSLEAARTLSLEEFSQLLVFLGDPRAGSKYPQGLLQAKLTQRLQEFYLIEQQMSGLPSNELSIPGGPVDADLGIALHLATGRDISRDFWDPRSASISLLQEKGMSDRFTFGYDWHWRAEEAYLDRSDCPVRKWPRHLRELHDQMSADILGMLSLPFLITGSACTRTNLSKTLKETNKRLEIPISLHTTLKFDLDFRNNSLRRMIAHVYHPSSGFTAKISMRESMASQIDAGLNFFLWLTGRSYDANSFRRTYSQAGPCRKKSAPLAEMYSYIRKEREEQRNLKLSEYSPSFLGWVGRYLFQDPVTILLCGNSVAVAALWKIRTKMSISRQRHILRARTQKELEREQESGNISEGFRSNQGQCLFHGKAVVVLKSGYVKLAAPAHDFRLHFRMAAREARRILALQKETKIYFFPYEVVLRVDNSTVYRKPIERLLASVHGEEWLVQIVSELKVIQGGLAKETGSGQVIPEARLAVIPHDNRLGNSWRNGELQRKLSIGSIFPCTEISNSAKVGRVYFKGLQLYVPQKADFNTVFVQCDLVPEGFRHPNACPAESDTNDPANRLGIRVCYKVRGSSERSEFWATMDGECNTKILNSLVDFLDGRSEEWTEKQPRRFLPRNILKGRRKISYTS
ncbi:uncharacterized protein BO80DRAFT_478634 [Aspergillus ibericus CBS 121593]|uniref:Uncharacterized protein n=1 Tax=Aspergillus ibericus CBS 121593 TaxID=1448316 RepID=A0A395GUR1_9EURO|nr:hypothetical protein BO80DRAFT_478634 [Aspergillus ibericus CBS 121593]RAK99169.1 hypothetical protein BO80DRAFT_478634 [Aspergillus ibericus CBS 121593]